MGVYMKILSRKDLPADYDELMKTEQHHEHEIVMVDNIIRWKANEGVRELVDSCDLNHIILDMQINGIDRNHEVYRRLYRNMGYSLSSYWDAIDNPEADEYTPDVDVK